LKEIHNILSMNRIWRTRLYEIGIIERDFCLFFGLSGVLSRAANIWIDARFSGYELYNSFDYSIFIASNGDCLDRYLLRFNEIIESCRIIYAILYFISSSLLSSSNSLNGMIFCRIFFMELLITEFMIRFPFILSLINELKLSIESSKGIYSIFLFSYPFISSNIVSNDYLTLNQLNKVCRYINIGDLIAILGSIDFVLGSVDLIILCSY
jgi:NADH:ubiquinone oxidoreductase subunit D